MLAAPHCWTSLRIHGDTALPGRVHPHLFLAFDSAGRAVGFVSGVETTQPDKGTEMFLYELGVDESARGRGLGRTLVAALGYERAGAHGSSSHLMFEWGFGTPS